MLTIFLSNKLIRAAVGESGGGKITVRQLYQTEDAGGAILNGTIVDREALTELLKDFWQKHKLPKRDVHLIIDSNQFTSREMQIPSMNHKKTMEYLKREFTGVERIADPVYGYFTIGKPDKVSRLQRVEAIAAPREYISGFIDMFKSLDITLTGIEGVRGVLNRLFCVLDQVKEESCIIQLIDDMNLTNVLWINGSIETSNRKRMFADPGTPAYSVEMSRAANNLMQFAKAQNIEQPVADVYAAGISEEDLEIYQNSIGNINAALTVHKLPAGKSISFTGRAAEEKDAILQYTAVIGGLLRTDSASNLMTQMKYTPEQMEERANRKKLIVPGAALIGVAAVAALILLGRNLYLQHTLKELQDYNQDPKIVQTCMEYDELSRRLNAESGIAGGLTRLTDTLAAYPKVDGSMEGVIMSCAAGLVDVSISGYDSTDGELSLQTSAAQVEQIHRFVNLLMAQGIFADVNYTGYAQEQEGTWNVNVQCILAPESQEDGTGTD